LLYRRRSKLFYRGYSIEALPSHSTFEETTYLLIYGSLPTRSQLEDFTKRISLYRPLETSLLQLIHSFPRYVILKKLGAELAAQKGETKLFETATAIEESALRHLAGSPIFPNVDSYSGIVFHTLGIPTDLFTPVFVMSRIAGWTAHAIEYLQANRLIRPKALYVGQKELPYVPIDSRQD